MRVCSVLLLAACATAAPAPTSLPATSGEAPAPRIVSVLELRSRLREGAAIDPGYVADRLRAEVLSSGIDARVISRENMLVLLQAQGKQLADCEAECEVETGRRIGADLVVSGELLRVGESLKASLRLHETRSGTLVAAATAAGATAEELDARLGSAVRQLVAPFGRAAPSAASRKLTRAQAAFDAKAFAATQASPFDCESAARRLRDMAPDNAWAALAACVERQGWPRGDFTYLERITGGFWDEELTTRSDAPRLIARIIASRGGDVEGDIPLVQKSRVPLFTLAAALRQPDVYKGRWVLVRGALSEIRQDGGRTAAVMRETSLRATAREVQVGNVSRVDSSSSGSSRSDGQVSRYGSARGSAQYSGTGGSSQYSGSGHYSGGSRYSGSSQYSSGSRTEYSSVKQKFENERVDTGRLALGRLARADPFLEPEKDFLFLARFDGVSAACDQEQPMALLSIAGYFQPSPFLVQ
jgi:hypothetical protein